MMPYSMPHTPSSTPRLLPKAKRLSQKSFSFTALATAALKL
jgi:hypothetical protein